MPLTDRAGQMPTGFFLDSHVLHQQIISCAKFDEEGTTFKFQMTNPRLDFWFNGVDNAGRILFLGPERMCSSLTVPAHLLKPIMASMLGAVPS